MTNPSETNEAFDRPKREGRVLVVDDEPGMRYMARRVFEDRFDVVEAETGEEALQLLDQHEFNFAVVDVSLPGLSGLKLLTKIKDQRPEIDVVVMTGSASDPDDALEDAIRRKAFFFLRKPFPMTVLETLADRIIENQSLSKQLARQVRSLQKDLDAARIFQKGLLPPTHWKEESIEVCSQYIASDRLSGDFLDYWKLRDGSSALFIADVMGHGPAAAMATGMIKTQIHRLAKELDDPGAVLTALEADLSLHHLRGFLTAFLVFDRPDQGVIQYAGAGHPPFFFLSERGASVQRLSAEGIPLNTGMVAPAREARVLPRKPGSRIMLYTDGYSEAKGSGDLFFDESDHDGATPLDEAAKLALDSAPLENGIEALESRLLAYSTEQQDDDRAVILAEFT